MSEPTPEQMRSMGYAAGAKPVRLSDDAFIAFCAWVNYPPEKMQDFMRYKPDETAAAWERVAAALASRHDGCVSSAEVSVAPE